MKLDELMGASRGLAISQLAQKEVAPIIVVTSTLHEANVLLYELQLFSSANLPLFNFPDWETLPYDHFSAHEDIISERLSILYQLPHLKKGIVIIAVPTLMHQFLPRHYLNATTFILSQGATLNLMATRQDLINAGYRLVSEVMAHGEFSVRGSILDLYPMGAQSPYRIELFDNEVESIRSFDPETQRSIHKVDHIKLLPAHEYPLHAEAIAHFRQSWRAHFTGNPLDAPLYQQISEGKPGPGIEYYLPLFFEKMELFFDYLPPISQFILLPHIQEKADEFWQEANKRYEMLRYDQLRPLCEPKSIFIDTPSLFAQFKLFDRIQNTTLHAYALPPLNIEHKNEKPLHQLLHFIQAFFKNAQGRVLFCAESTGRREILLELLANVSIYPKIYPSWHDFLNDTHKIGILVARIDTGMWLEQPAMALIPEALLFGEQVLQRRLRKALNQDPNTMIRNLMELSMGAPVVHIDHGVGRYLGLQTMMAGGFEAEYLTLEYANQDKIYVPVTNLHLISRYSGADTEHAPLQRLGSKQWEREKEKAIKKIHDVAAELLDIYGRRQAAKGHAFSKPDLSYEKFCQEFPFEETPDQLKAIKDVIQDMTSEHLMERLVCGDVGFGKTEVAMRGAFLAVQDNKQVAILVPTTLLAQQHLQNFQDRFSDWPVKIAGLSRLRSAKEQEEILKELANGKIDIIIGTHKLINGALKFKNLGLLIIDEEHRFGVRQKEKIKSLRENIDILTLTATPIPRTLNMALSGIRDLSIIATPPARRLSIKTFIHEYNPSLIREAILRESLRGGQVYFLHNDVQTINATAESLKALLPEVRIGVAHGQMPERQLERTMSDFYHQHYHILVCTTIIESGIDVPNANTIIIHRADRFGLAQLHQLRGRVGRSHHQAYAYLLTPPPEALTSDAKKRLDAIAELGDLGMGFNLATFDLEIRGTGELLGEEQSGHLHALGFTLYMDLLEETVALLKSGKEPSLEKSLKNGTEVDLGVSAMLPKDYIDDVHIRLILYKRLANCASPEEIQNLKVELIDRFGALPLVAKNLFQQTEIKLRAQQQGIKKIEVGQQYGYLFFNAKPNIDPQQLVLLIQKEPHLYQLQGTDRLRFKLVDQNIDKRIEVLQILLTKIAAQ